MESEVKQVESALHDAGIKLENGGTLAPMAASDDPNEQLKEMLGKTYEVVENLPDRLAALFTEYKQLLTTLGLVAGSVIAVKLTLSLLASLNEIPLVQPFLELVGLGYTTWFVIRFLLKAEKRQDFYSQFTNAKDQVLGNRK